jgi:peroxiredoxin
MKTLFSSIQRLLLLSAFGLLGSTGISAELAGLKVGKKAPAFELKDQDGQVVQLGELRKKGPVALVFFRSADWCPFCQKQLVQLQSELKNIRNTGVTLVGISYDPVEVLKRFSTKRDIKFPLLSDPGSKTIIAYDLLNVDDNGKSQGIPHPMTLLVDTNGVIRAKLGFEGYRTRHDVDALIKAVEKLKSN